MNAECGIKKIAIAAPARKVSPEEMEFAIRWLHDNGFESVFDERLYSVENIAAGSDALRASIIQEYMDRDDIDANPSSASAMSPFFMAN